MIRVTVSDDQPLFRAALAQAIEDAPELELLATAADGPETLKMIQEREPDVAILDIHLRDLDGLEIIRTIRRAALDTRVLVISEEQAGDTVLHALTAGATGYLSKRAGGAEILAAITAVAEGRAVLPSEVGTNLAMTLRDRGPSGTLLSPRELTVLKMLADGASGRHIALALHLAVPTVRTHIQNLYAKLGVNNRGAAVAEAMRRGLVA